MAKEITTLQSSQCKFLFKHCYDNNDIIDVINEASSEGVKIIFDDIKEDITIYIELIRGVDERYHKITIDVQNCEFIGGTFSVTNIQGDIVCWNIKIGNEKHDICNFLAERYVAVKKITGKDIIINKIILIDNTHESYINYQDAENLRIQLDSTIDYYIRTIGWR